MLNVGDKAPKFELASDDAPGKKVGPGSFPGKYVVVYFYPRDNTPGCTRQAQAFAASAQKFAKAGAAVVGISKDSLASHGKFRSNYKLNFPLLSDTDLTVHKAFGSYGEKTMYGKKVLGTIRSTFILDPKGKVARVFPNVRVDGHADAVLEAIAELQGGGSTKGAAPPKGGVSASKQASSAGNPAAKAKSATKSSAPSKKSAPLAGSRSVTSKTTARKSPGTARKGR